MRPRRTAAALPATTLSVRDLVAEATAGLLQRPARSMLTMLGTVLGIGALVAILGLTATAGAQIGKRFSLLEATQVTVEDVSAGPADDRVLAFPSDADDRVRRIDGVTAGGRHWKVPLGGRQVSRLADVRRGAVPGIVVVAASPGLLDAAGVTLAAGRTYDAFHERRAERVAVVGAAAARTLGIGQLDVRPAVFVGETPYAVVGVLADSQRLPELSLAVVIPTSTALAEFGRPEAGEPAKMLVETRLGAASVVARQVPVALRPDAPHVLRAVAPPDPRSLRSAVASDVNELFLLLAAVAIVIGALGIANTTLVAILERTGEIGVRRALGARRRHIAAQFLAESTILGTIGGLVGASAGVVTVVVVALRQDWTAVVDPVTVLPAPLAGGLVGLLAGAYPALRAAAIEPVAALQR